MITDKDRLDAPYMPSALLTAIRRRSGGHWGWSNKKALDKIYERDRFIRAESAEQARKEAAERVAYAWREHGEDITLRIIHDAILSTVNESFTVAHVSTDTDKLAIAVKALEEIKTLGTHSTLSGRTTTGERIDSTTIINTYGIKARDALKEIQG